MKDMLNKIIRSVLLVVLLLALPTSVLAQQRKPRSKPRVPKPNMVTGLDPYRSIVLPDNVNLVLKMGEVPSVEVKAERAIVKNLVCEVKGGTLYVSLLPCKISQQWAHLKLIVGVDSTFREVTMGLGGNISCDGLLRLNSLTVNGGSSTSTNLSVDVSGGVRLNTKSTCDIIMRGKAGYVNVEARGNSKVSTRELSAPSTSVLADGESRVVVGAAPQLSVEAHDFSKVYYDAAEKPLAVSCDTGAQLIVDTREK